MGTDKSERQTEFESLTDAWAHLYYTNKDRDDYIHHMITEIREVK